MIRPAARIAAFISLAVLTGAASPATSPVDVPEPVELYDGPQGGYVPATLKGAEVIDLSALDRLLAAEKPVLLDVSLADRKPDNLPAGTIWLPSHRSIPGAHWLPNAGAAPLAEQQETRFHERVAALTANDKTRPIVVFCHPECWGSWNAGKRLVQAGYTNVYWFPLGIEGWQDVHETAVVSQDASWATVKSPGNVSEPQR